MSIDGYTGFLTAMGHDVIEVSGTRWFNAHPYLYTSLPFDAQLNPEDIDWKAVFAGRCLAVRIPVINGWGRESYRIVADDPLYSLASLSGKARNQTKRGLEQCEAKPICLRELASIGLRLDRDTRLRQKRIANENTDRQWIKYCMAADRAEGAHAWGALIGGELAALLIAFTMGRCSHILIVRSALAGLKNYPNNALMFSYIREMLGSGKVDEISIGFESIQMGMDALDHFKMGMGFRKKPVNQYVRFSPLVEIFLKGPGSMIARKIAGTLARSENGKKIQGLLRWYSEQMDGKR